MGQVPHGLPRYRAAAQPYHAALRAAHRHQSIRERPQVGTCLPGPAKTSVTSSASTHHQQRPRSPAATSRPQPQRNRAGMPLQRVQIGSLVAFRPCECRKPHPSHAIGWYWLIMPSARVCFRNAVLVKVDWFG